ncbi:MAG: hypothetical protein ACYTJ0_14650 [Planctomycetota bacterium]|jgi:hypothetical protein
MTINDDIQHDASALLDFMRNNIVFPTGMQGAASLDSDNLHWVRFEPGWAPEAWPPYNGKPANGTIALTGAACNVYFLKNLGLSRPAAPIPADAFEAYWVPYEQDQLATTMLGTRSRIMFTAKMDGCSFGLGSNDGAGNCLAGHANSATKATKWGFRAAGGSQRKMLVAGGLQYHIEAATYRDLRTDEQGRQVGWNGQGTTFGIRTGNSWKVYTQRITGSSPNFTHKGLVTGINQP